jgi:hypothetical protein
VASGRELQLAARLGVGPQPRVLDGGRAVDPHAHAVVAAAEEAVRAVLGRGEETGPAPRRSLRIEGQRERGVVVEIHGKVEGG